MVPLPNTKSERLSHVHCKLEVFKFNLTSSWKSTSSWHIVSLFACCDVNVETKHFLWVIEVLFLSAGRHVLRLYWKAWNCFSPSAAALWNEWQAFQGRDDSYAIRCVPSVFIRDVLFALHVPKSFHVVLHSKHSFLRSALLCSWCNWAAEGATGM